MQTQRLVRGSREEFCGAALSGGRAATSVNFLSSMYTSDLTSKLKIMYKRLNLLIVALFVAVVGAGCGRADKSPATKRAQQAKAVLESTEVQAKKVALVNALKKLHLPDTWKQEIKEIIRALEQGLESMKEQCSGGGGIKEGELNEVIVGLDRMVQFLKGLKNNLVPALNELKSRVRSQNTLEGCLNEIGPQIRALLPADAHAFVDVGVDEMKEVIGSMSDEKRAECMGVIKRLFESTSTDAMVAVYDACTDLASAILADLERIKS